MRSVPAENFFGKHDARGIDDAPQRSQVGCRVQSTSDGSFVRHVDAGKPRIRAKLGSETGARRFVHIGDDDARPRRDEEPGCRFSKPRRRAGDEEAAVLEVQRAIG